MRKQNDGHTEDVTAQLQQYRRQSKSLGSIVNSGVIQAKQVHRVIKSLHNVTTRAASENDEVAQYLVTLPLVDTLETDVS